MDKPDGMKMFDDMTAKIEDVEEPKRTLVVRITTDHKDRDDEVVLPGGLDLTDFNNNPIVLFAHQYGEPPIAKALWTKTGEHEVISKPKFAETERADEVFKLYAGGFMRAWSIGFGVKEGGYRKATEKDVQDRPDWAGVRGIVEKSTLFEYSAVPVPCNPYALSLAVEKGLVKVPKEIELPDIGEPWDIAKPIPNEHLGIMCDIGDFEPDSFRRFTKNADCGKSYGMIMGRLKGKQDLEVYAHLYHKDAWKTDEAQRAADSGSFIPAKSVVPTIIRIHAPQPKIIRVSTEPTPELISRIRREEEARIRGKMSL